MFNMNYLNRQWVIFFLAINIILESKNIYVFGVSKLNLNYFTDHNNNSSFGCNWFACVSNNKEHHSYPNVHSSNNHGYSYFYNSKLTPVMVPKRNSWKPVNKKSYHTKKLKTPYVYGYEKHKYQSRYIPEPQRKAYEDHHEEKCDGYENFIKDLEIISFELGVIGFTKATIAWILHVINQIYIFYSVYLIGIPERLTTILEIIFPETIPVQISTILTVLGLIDYFVIKLASYPVGNLIVVIDFFAEIITLMSLTLAFITIFDDVVQQKVWAFFGIDLKVKLEGYGCNNPFDKQQYIEEWVKMLG